jgi:drug/metabolite transporter (DMT)-like permease
MVVVMAGVVLVARFSAEDGIGKGERYGHDHVRRSVWIALGASVGFAFAVMAAQGAAAIYGELPTLWMVRWIGVFCLLPVFARNRGMPRLPARWLPLLALLALQGLLDSGAYVALFRPAGQDGAEIAVVVASGFSAVTVLLARIVLREAMTRPQWAGIAAIVGGTAALSYYS